MSDQSQQFQQQVLSAVKNNQALRIEGGNSKNFLGNKVDGDVLSTRTHSGVVSYDPSELVITARSGTPLCEIKQVLADNQQMLAFEPPSFGEQATLGGTIACNLSGPARAYAGAARDFVLGCKVINGKGEILQFGGQVIKNVAGYDASRLMAGAYGTLGLILEVSLKVLPMAHRQMTIAANMTQEKAIKTINELSGKNLPITASSFFEDQLYIRFSSTHKNTQSVHDEIKHLLNAQTIENSDDFWQSVREQQHDFFKTDKTLWRLSVPATTNPLDFSDEQFIEWGGACRWLKTDMDERKLRQKIKAVGGHAMIFRQSPGNAPVSFQPLDAALMQIHQRLKKAFDPAGILNPGRLYKGL